MVDSLFIDAPLFLFEVCVWSLFFGAVLSAVSSFAINSLGKRQSALLYFNCLCISSLSCYCYCSVPLPHGAAGCTEV